MNSVDELFVLVHAPVVGPASWAPVAAELADSGHRVAVPSLAGFADAGPPYAPKLVELARAQVPGGAADSVVLVVHSGAGVFAPYLAEAIAATKVAVVFADAALPPASGPGDVVDRAFLPFLRGLASGAVVPPWPQWWPEHEMSALVPDERTRRSVLGEARPLPLAFFAERLPPRPDSWQACHPSYLRFSKSYEEPAREAAGRGWPVRELPGEHLHMLVRPADVAAAITSLAAAPAT
jgi:hypothetical protein